MEDNGLEPMTSCMPCGEHSESHPASHWLNRSADEPLHQWLHQILKLDERTIAELLVSELGLERCKLIVEAIKSQSM